MAEPAGSRGWTRPSGAAVAILLVLGLAPARATDTLVLEDGRRIQVDQWWRDGERLMYRKYGGTVGIPSGSVRDILEGGDGSDERLDSPGAAGYPGARAHSAALAVAPPPTTSDAEGWERELEELGSQLREHPDTRDEVARRMAVLWTTGGNQRYRDQDIPGAVTAYETALGLDPALLDARRNLASAYLSAGRSLQALREADQVLEVDSTDVDALILRGEALYREERLDAAIEAWSRAHEIAPSPRTEQRLEKARREREVGGEFRRSDGAHFALHYDGAVTQGQVGEEVLTFLEAEFDRLVRRYNHLPPAVIVVILYPAREFHDVTGTPSWTGGIFDGKIRVPIGGLSRMTDSLRKTLTHELTHSFVASKSGGNASRWMQEGLAQLEEGKSPGRDILAVLRHSYRTDGSRWGQELDYPSSLALVDFLVARYGFHAFEQILEQERRGRSEEEALLQVLGITTDRLFQDWGAAMVSGDIR